MVGDHVELPPTSASIIAATMSTGLHMLKIEGYSLTKMLGRMEHMDSSKFQAAGHTWYIRYYPNKYGDDNPRIVLYLNLHHKATDVVGVKLRFQLIPHRGEPSLATPLEGLWQTDTPQHVFDVGSYGFTLEQSVLEKSGYLKDDSFIIECDIHVLTKPVARDAHDRERLAWVGSCKEEHRRTAMQSFSGLRMAFIKFFLGVPTNSTMKLRGHMQVQLFQLECL